MAETKRYKVRTAMRAKDGTLYRPGAAVPVAAKHVKEFGWGDHRPVETPEEPTGPRGAAAARAQAMRRASGEEQDTDGALAKVEEREKALATKESEIEQKTADLDKRLEELDGTIAAVEEKEQLIAEREESLAEREKRIAEGQEDIDLDPTAIPVKNLSEVLGAVSSPETVKALQAKDDRSSAEAAYKARIAELAGTEE